MPRPRQPVTTGLVMETGLHDHVLAAALDRRLPITVSAGTDAMWQVSVDLDGARRRCGSLTTDEVLALSELPGTHVLDGATTTSWTPLCRRRVDRKDNR